MPANAVRNSRRRLELRFAVRERRKRLVYRRRRDDTLRAADLELLHDRLGVNRGYKTQSRP